MAGMARTASVLVEIGARSKPSWCRASCSSSAVATSSVSAAEGHRDQQRLRRHLLPVEGGLQFFIHDAFMRGVHVHHDQALLVLREDVDAGELAECEAERVFWGRIEDARLRIG